MFLEMTTRKRRAPPYHDKTHTIDIRIMVKNSMVCYKKILGGIWVIGDTSAVWQHPCIIPSHAYASDMYIDADSEKSWGLRAWQHAEDQRWVRLRG